MATTKLEELGEAYDLAEAGFLAAVRNNSDRMTLAAAALATATAADAFNTEAYRKFHSREEDAWMPLDWLTERTEVLAEMWADLADAYSVCPRSQDQT